MKKSKLAIPSREKPRIPRQVFADLIMELHNRRLTVFDIRIILTQRLRDLDNWGFICPRVHLDCIEEDFILEEMNYDAMLSELNSAQAVFIYQQWDAVMVAKKTDDHGN